MKKYNVISFDMFQTLVDVNQRAVEIWKGILGEEYTKEKRMAGTKAVINNLASAYRNAVHPFHTMEQMFMDCAEHVVKETGFTVPPEKVAHQLMYQHGFAPFYEESQSVLEQLSPKYYVIISSDASHLMVDPLLTKCNVNRAFISDDLHCYKGDKTGGFFQDVLSELEEEPEKILHIGDSQADIVGAHAVGMHACLIDRDHKGWRHPQTEPDYIIHSLNEIFDIL